MSDKDKVYITILKRFEFDKEALQVVIGNAIRWGVHQDLIWMVDRDPNLTINPEDFGKAFVAFVQSSSGEGVPSSGQFNYVDQGQAHEQDS